MVVGAMPTLAEKGLPWAGLVDRARRRRGRKAHDRFIWPPVEPKKPK
jgi:hypothetical protein